MNETDYDTNSPVEAYAPTYRLVADYGFGDMTWVKEGLSAEEAVAAFNNAAQCSYANIKDVLARGPGYVDYVEEEDGSTNTNDCMDS